MRLLPLTLIPVPSAVSLAVWQVPWMIAFPVSAIPDFLECGMALRTGRCGVSRYLMLKIELKILARCAGWID